MKIQKIFTISEDLVRELSLVKNQSALVEGLLREHFNHDREMEVYRTMPLDQLKEIAKIEKKKEELKAQLEELEKEENGKVKF